MQNTSSRDGQVQDGGERKTNCFLYTHTHNETVAVTLDDREIKLRSTQRRRNLQRDPFIEQNKYVLFLKKKDYEPMNIFKSEDILMLNFITSAVSFEKKYIKTANTN